MTGFFNAIKELFPRSRVFDLFIDSNKRRLIEALSELPDSIRRDAENVYLDLFPDTTRQCDLWEKVFSLSLTSAEYPKRRNIIDALWKTVSGDQGTNFIEQVLRKIHPDFHVAENVPLTDPRIQRVVMLCVCDTQAMVCDNDAAFCDNRTGDDDFVPDILQNDTSSLYAIPDDVRYWEMCFFVCKEIHRGKNGYIVYVEPLVLNRVWKNIVEYLVLKIKPVQSTAVMFVKWIEEDI